MILAFATLSACQFGLGESSGGRPEVAAFSVTSLSPEWGSPDEETAVTISGTGLSAVTSVKFGRADVEITSVGDDELVVTAPAAGVPGLVTVTVSTATQDETLDFTYGDSAPDPDDTGGGGGDNSGAGKTGGLIQFSFTQYTCPDCYGLTTDLVVSAQAGFHTATNAGWVDWMPDEGSCVSDATPTSPTGAFLDAGRWIYLNSGSVSLGLQADSSSIYTASGATEDDWVSNAGYDLSVGGGDDLDQFEVADAFTTPQGFDTITPTEILYTSDRDLFTARISRSGQALTWSPSGGTGTFMVEVVVFSADGTSQLGSAVCLGPDNGRMTIPSSFLSYPTGSLVLLGMHRYSIGGFDRPDDGSTVETVVSRGVVGTGSIAP